MKKQLLSIFAAVATLSVVAQQTPSPSWTISQNANFSITAAGVRYLDAVDANVVWLTGYDGFAANANYNWFARTTNGGISYNSGNIFPDTLNFQISNLEGIDANTAWVSAFRKPSSNQGVIYSTNNGGATWTNMTAPGMFTNTSSFADVVSFLTPSIGIAMGDPVNGEFEIWRTTNGGNAWTPVAGANIPNPVNSSEFAIVNLYCKEGTTNIWFGTNQGRVYRSNDAGATWNVSAIVAPGQGTLTEVAFASPTHGMVYLVNSSSVLQVYSTTDGGVNWTLMPSTDPNMGRNDICGIPGTTYFASVGAGTGNQIISYTKNMGLTWIDWASQNIQYLCVDFVDASTGWAGSFSSQTNPGLEGVWKYNGSTFNSSFSLPPNICKGAGSVTVSPLNNSAGAPPLTFTWSAQPAGAVFASPNASVPVITFSAYGTYTISLAVTNGGGGTSSSSQVISILSCGTPTAGFLIPTTVCNNVPFTFTNTSIGVPNPSVTISTSAVNGVTVAAFNGSLTTIRFSTPGIYSITALASSISGTNSVTQTINVIDCTPVANFSVPTPTDCIIAGDVNSMVVITTTNSTSGTAPFTYNWNVSPNTGVQVLNSGPANKTISFSTAGTYSVTLIASNASGPSMPVTKVVVIDACASSTTSVSENKSLSVNLNIFPNPAHDQLNIVLPASKDAYNVTLVNVIGAVVFEEKSVKSSKETMTINLTNKAKGIYFLTVESNNEKAIKKIVVE